MTPPWPGPTHPTGPGTFTLPEPSGPPRFDVLDEAIRAWPGALEMGDSIRRSVLLERRSPLLDRPL